MEYIGENLDTIKKLRDFKTKCNREILLRVPIVSTKKKLVI